MTFIFIIKIKFMILIIIITIIIVISVWSFFFLLISYCFPLIFFYYQNLYSFINYIVKGNCMHSKGRVIEKEQESRDGPK